VPWFASINGCGGVLVAPDRVATAGHCVRNRSMKLVCSVIASNDGGILSLPFATSAIAHIPR
jgi:Trypsin